MLTCLGDEGNWPGWPPTTWVKFQPYVPVLEDLTSVFLPRHVQNNRNKRRRTYEASGAKLVSLSEYLSFPSKLNLDYFIFCSILVSFSVIFIPFLLWTKKDVRRSRAVLYMFKRKQKWKTDYQHVISSKKSSLHLISVSALRMHFDIYRGPAEGWHRS